MLIPHIEIPVIGISHSRRPVETAGKDSTERVGINRLRSGYFSGGVCGVFNVLYLYYGLRCLQISGLLLE